MIVGHAVPTQRGRSGAGGYECPAANFSKERSSSALPMRRPVNISGGATAFASISRRRLDFKLPLPSSREIVRSKIGVEISV